MCSDSPRALYSKSGYTPLHDTNTARKRRTWWKAQFRCLFRLSSRLTKESNQDGLRRDPDASKVTHYPQITIFRWPTSRMCTAFPRALLCCLYSVMQHYISYEYTSGKQNTHQIARFRCYLKLFVHWTWNQEGLLCDGTVPHFMRYAQTTKF